MGGEKKELIYKTEPFVFTATDLDHFVPFDLSDGGEIFILCDQLPVLLPDGALVKTKNNAWGSQTFCSKTPFVSQEQNMHGGCS